MHWYIDEYNSSNSIDIIFNKYCLGFWIENYRQAYLTFQK